MMKSGALFLTLGIQHPWQGKLSICKQYLVIPFCRKWSWLDIYNLT